jgi:RND family efflux transporter MFP subunit
MSARPLSRPQRLGGLALLAVALLWVGNAAVVRLQARFDPEPARDRPPIAVEVVEVETRAFTVARAYRATVDVDERAEVTARITGEVLELPHREGAWVESGELLFRLDDDEQRRELERLEAVAERLSGELELARRELRRQEALLEHRITPERAVDDARQRVATLSAQVRESQASHALVRTRLGYAEGRAPFAGRVQRLHVHEGELARAGSPIVELVSAAGLKAVARVPQVDATRILPGMAVDLEVPALGLSWPARVDRVYPALQASTRSATVAVLLPPEAESVRVGMAAIVHVQLEQLADAIAVAAAAVHGDAGSHWVFVFESGVAKRRSVELGARREGVVRIEAGLEPGERVIVTADPRLADGAEVRLAHVPESR